MLVSGLDNQLTSQTRTTCIQAAESLLVRDNLAKFAYARLFGCPLAKDAEIEDAFRLASEADATKAVALYSDLKRARGTIAAARAILDELLFHDFEDECDPEAARRAFVDSGVVADAMMAAVERDEVSPKGRPSIGPCDAFAVLAPPNTPPTTPTTANN